MRYGNVQDDQMTITEFSTVCMFSKFLEPSKSLCNVHDYNFLIFGRTENSAVERIFQIDTFFVLKDNIGQE